MSQSVIRPAKVGDESAIHEAHMRSIREVCVKDHGEEEIRGWGNRPLGNRWNHAVRVGHVWVVELDSRIAGHGYIRIYEELGEFKAHMHGLYLTPEVLGQGLGFKLAQLMIAKAQEAGAKQITLESTLTAHDFYKRLGFVDSGPMLRVEIAGHPVRAFPMVLPLSTGQ